MSVHFVLIRFGLTAQSECQRLCGGRPNLDTYMTYLSKSLWFADFTATFERWEDSLKTVYHLLEVTLVFEARDLNSVIQQTVRSGIWRNWRRRKLHLAKTACENRSSESLCLSASNCKRHRAKNDFRHQEMDSLVLWYCNTLLWLWTTYGSRNHDCWKR